MQCVVLQRFKMLKITDPNAVVLYKTWHRIRKPFLLPFDQITHNCGNSWEKFDIDKAGCTECGRYHLCEHGECEYTMTADSLVCEITGLCVKPKILAADEHVCVAVHRSHNFLQFTSESGHSFSEQHCLEETNQKKKKSDNLKTCEQPLHVKKHMSSHCLNNAFGSSIYEEQMQIVLTTLKQVMCSAKTRESICRENEKLRHHLRSVVPQTLKQYKAMKKIPSICDLETQLHLQCNLIRIPPSEIEWNVDYMRKLAQQAAIPITRLMIFMRTFCSNIPICIRQNTIVVGLLYMLRRGVVVHNVTVLPKISTLRDVLPLEQHLVTVFNIRAKIITEAENVIKFILRNIPCEILHLLHMPM